MPFADHTPEMQAIRKLQREERISFSEAHRRYFTEERPKQDALGVLGKALAATGSANMDKLEDIIEYARGLPNAASDPIGALEQAIAKAKLSVPDDNAPAVEAQRVLTLTLDNTGVTLGHFEGRNDVERAMAYVRHQPGGDALSHRQVWQHACEIVRAARAHVAATRRAPAPQPTDRASQLYAALVAGGARR